MIKTSNGNIVIKANYTKEQKITIIGCLLVFLLCLLYGIMQKFYSFMSGFLGFSGWFVFLLRKHSFVKISSDQIEFFIFNIMNGDFYTHTVLNFSMISKAELKEDYCLIFYDNENEEGKSADIECFEQTDIQALINLLGKRIPIFVDAELEKQGIKTPNHISNIAISQSTLQTNVSPSGSGRKRVVSNANSRPQTTKQPNNTFTGYRPRPMNHPSNTFTGYRPQKMNHPSNTFTNNDTPSRRLEL